MNKAFGPIWIHRHLWLRSRHTKKNQQCRLFSFFSLTGDRENQDHHDTFGGIFSVLVVGRLENPIIMGPKQDLALSQILLFLTNH